VKRNDWIFTIVVAVLFAGLAGGFLEWIHSFGPKSGGSPSGAAAAVGSGSGSQASRLVIPSIGADAPVVDAGATGPDGGAFDVPNSVHVVAWWDGLWKSPNGNVQEKVAKPGQPGVALLAGHIDSAAQGHGALYRLQQIKTGAPITVYGANGSTTRWKVTRLQIVAKSALPKTLFVNNGPVRLAVVSCGGPFDAATGHYVDNVIAWASPAA